jgi:hypothetical protein
MPHFNCASGAQTTVWCPEISRGGTPATRARVRHGIPGAGLDLRQRVGWRAALLKRAGALLLQRGHEFVGEGRPPRHIGARVVGTAVLATLDYGSEDRYHVVLKPTELNRGVRSAGRLGSTLELLSGQDDRIAASFPEVLGGDERTSLLVLGYVPGEQLVSRLRRALQVVGPAVDDNAVYFRQAARVLAAVHRVPASTAGLPGESVRNSASFMGSFERTAARFASVFQAADLAEPAQLLARLPPGFFSRVGDRTSLIDARPKNSIVPPVGPLCFIDLDCAPGSPAMGVAAFLASLDRMGARHPSPAAQSRLAGWKRAFVDEYFACDHVWPAEDLMFFYPWTVLQMFEQHRADHPWLTPYLQWYYGTRLEQFLAHVKRLSNAQLAHSPAMLFRSAAAAPGMPSLSPQVASTT